MLFNKYAVSVKRHIREGICIPLAVKPDLVRNITTRNLWLWSMCTVYTLILEQSLSQQTSTDK